MKKLANLEGTKALNRKEQKEIFGGAGNCPSNCTRDSECGGNSPNCLEYFCDGNSGPTSWICSPSGGVNF